MIACQLQRFAILILSLLVLPQVGLACFNTGDDVDPLEYEFHNGTYPIPTGHGVDTSSSRVRDDMDLMRNRYQTGDEESSVRYGLYLVYFGRYKEAEKVFRHNQKKWPDTYESAANLGTILELNGKLEESLKWIKKSIAISPDSHSGSEFLHVRILEAEIRGKFYPEKLVGIQYGDGEIPNSGLTSDSLFNLAQQVYVQLNERVSFINPPDEIIGALMFELGNMIFEQGDFGNAETLYRLAQKYGFETPELSLRIQATIQQKLEHPSTEYPQRQSSHSSTKSSNDTQYALYGCGLLALLCLRFIIRLSRKPRTPR